MIKPDKPFYDKRIFWDVDSDKMDVEAKANFIIERVFERGDVEDIRYCRRFYGDEKIRIALENAKWLNLSTIYIATALFDNKLTGYKCFTQIQSDPLHSLY
jgi:hypothetical protein